MSPETTTEQLLPLPPATLHILLALADGERHGYSIMTEIAERTGGETRVGPGTLYGSIKRMLANGLIDETQPRRKSPDDDERRRYYKLTSFGRAVASAEAARLDALVRQARRKRLLTALDTTR